MYQTYTGGRRVTMGDIFPALFFSILMAAVGFYAGKFVPQALFMPLMVVEMIMVIAAVIIRRRKAVGYGFLYTFTFLSGITMYPVLIVYAHLLGEKTLFLAFGVTVLAYGGAALYAVITKADFSFLGSFLFIGLLVLMAMGIMSFFIPLSGVANWVYTLLGVFIFIGYTLFDMSRIVNYGVAQEDVPYVVLSLYLDFVNLFLYILRLFGLFSNDD